MEGRGENFDLIYTMGHKPSKYMARHVFKARSSVGSRVCRSR